MLDRRLLGQRNLAWTAKGSVASVCPIQLLSSRTFVLR